MFKEDVLISRKMFLHRPNQLCNVINNMKRTKISRR